MLEVRMCRFPPRTDSPSRVSSALKHLVWVMQLRWTVGKGDGGALGPGLLPIRPALSAEGKRGLQSQCFHPEALAAACRVG